MSYIVNYDKNPNCDNNLFSYKNLNHINKTQCRYLNIKISENSNNLDLINFINLNTLVISGIGILYFPKNINTLSKLEILDISLNHIKKIPNCICCDLSKLRILNIMSNKLTLLPKKIGYLVNLVKLNCGENKLVTISKNIGMCLKIEELNVSGNNLLFIPKSIRKLIQLKKLYINDNLLVSIDFIKYFVNLNLFYCDYNNLPFIPNNIGKLTKLQDFGCRYNNIKKIPLSIMNCKNLRDFIVDNLELDYIPDNLYSFLENTCEYNLNTLKHT